MLVVPEGLLRVQQASRGPVGLPLTSRLIGQPQSLQSLKQTKQKQDGLNLAVCLFGVPVGLAALSTAMAVRHELLM